MAVLHSQLSDCTSQVFVQSQDHNYVFKLASIRTFSVMHLGDLQSDFSCVNCVEHKCSMGIDTHCSLSFNLRTGGYDTAAGWPEGGAEHGD